MNRGELAQSVLTASLTLLGGTALFVLNQWLQKFFFEPLQEQRKVIGEIDFRLTFSAAFWANPIAYDRPMTEHQKRQREEASEALRDCAARLIATTNAIRWYALARGAPKESNVRTAARCLISLSNSMFSGTGADNKEDANQIRSLLKLNLVA